MSEKASKSKEERLLEMFIKNYITETQYFEMLKKNKRIKIRGVVAFARPSFYLGIYIQIIIKHTRSIANNKHAINTPPS